MARLFLVFLLLLVPAVDLPAQTSSPNAADILERSYLAMGGASVASISDVEMTGQVVAHFPTPQPAGTVTFKMLGRSEFRTDTVFGSDTLSYVVNGNRANQLRGGKAQRLPYHVLVNGHPDFFPVFSEVSEWEAPGYIATLVGEESLNGAPVYHIVVSKALPPGASPSLQGIASLGTADLYVDASSYLLVKRARRVPSIANYKNTILQEAYFSDYRPEGGLAVPHTIAVLARGQKTLDITITSVTFSTGLSSADFEVR